MLKLIKYTSLLLLAENVAKVTYNTTGGSAPYDHHAGWDDQKAASNLIKHGVDFADAVTALEDEAAITVVDEFAAEERFITIGTDALSRLLVVGYTWCGEDTIRLISARKATPHER